MSGSPPQMLTMGASHSFAAARHFSSGTMSLSDVEYSRIRPQPVHVKLHVCNGSSWRTIANFGVLRILCLTMWPAIFADTANGKRISSTHRRDLDWNYRWRRNGNRWIRWCRRRRWRDIEQAAQQPAAARNQKIRWRKALRGANAAAAGGQNQHAGAGCRQ